MKEREEVGADQETAPNKNREKGKGAERKSREKEKIID